MIFFKNFTILLFTIFKKKKKRLDLINKISLQFTIQYNITTIYLSYNSGSLINI